MNSEQFTWWLQGFVEMNPNAMVTGTQWQIIKDHLALVFKKETPYRGIQVAPPGATPWPRQPAIGYPFGTPSAPPYNPVLTC